MKATITTERDHANLESLAQEVLERGYKVAELGDKENYIVGVSPTSMRLGFAIGERINLTPGSLAKGTKVLVMK